MSSRARASGRAHAAAAAAAHNSTTTHASTSRSRSRSTRRQVTQQDMSSVLSPVPSVELLSAQLSSLSAFTQQQKQEIQAIRRELEDIRGKEQEHMDNLKRISKQIAHNNAYVDKRWFVMFAIFFAYQFGVRAIDTGYNLFFQLQTDPTASYLQLITLLFTASEYLVLLFPPLLLSIFIHKMLRGVDRNGALMTVLYTLIGTAMQIPVCILLFHVATFMLDAITSAQHAYPIVYQLGTIAAFLFLLFVDYITAYLHVFVK